MYCSICVSMLWKLFNPPPIRKIIKKKYENIKKLLKIVLNSLANYHLLSKKKLSRTLKFIYSFSFLLFNCCYLSRKVCLSQIFIVLKVIAQNVHFKVFFVVSSKLIIPSSIVHSFYVYKGIFCKYPPFLRKFKKTKIKITVSVKCH